MIFRIHFQRTSTSRLSYRIGTSTEGVRDLISDDPIQPGRQKKTSATTIDPARLHVVLQKLLNPQ